MVLCPTRCADRELSIVEQVLALADVPETVVDIIGKGPLAAIRSMDEHLPRDAVERNAFWATARISAVTGSLPRSKDSFRSGNCYLWHAVA